MTTQHMKDIVLLLVIETSHQLQHIVVTSSNFLQHKYNSDNFVKLESAEVWPLALCIFVHIIFCRFC